MVVALQVLEVQYCQVARVPAVGVEVLQVPVVVSRLSVLEISHPPPHRKTLRRAALAMA